MVASLTCAADWLRRAPVVVSYSDIFYPAPAVRALMDAPADIAITYDPEWLGLWSQRFDDPLSDAETFRLDGTRVVEIGRRAASLADIGGQYMGLLKFTPGGWRAVQGYLRMLTTAQRDRLDMTSLLSGLIDRGERIHAVRVTGPWGEVDNGRDLALYERLIAEGRLTLGDSPMCAA
jgi:choline kinase